VILFVAYLKELNRYLSGRTEETLGRYLNRILSEYELDT
jgi:hypothetical protein